MEELINQLKSFLGDKALHIFKKGPAEVEVQIKGGENIEQLSVELKAHIVDLVDETTIAQIDIVDEKGNQVDHFALNQ